MLLINNNNSSSSIMNRKLSKSIMLFKIRINRDTVKIAAYSVIKTSYLLKLVFLINQHATTLKSDII